MSQIRNFITPLHQKSQRDYQIRSHSDKPKYAEIAKQYGFEYWDGSRDVGYGGYRNDGRWQSVAKNLISTYGINRQSRILDIGCGKGFLLEELFQQSQCQIRGLDLSNYALEHSPPVLRQHLQWGMAQELPFGDHSFECVFSINTLHNLALFDLIQALKEIQRVTLKNSYICVESYRSEQEKWNLMRWQLTCEAFYSPKEWEYIFKLAGYTGDYEFIFFE